MIHTTQRVGKEGTRVHFLGDLLLVGHWIAALETSFFSAIAFAAVIEVD